MLDKEADPVQKSRLHGVYEHVEGKWFHNGPTTLPRVAVHSGWTGGACKCHKSGRVKNACNPGGGRLSATLARGRSRAAAQTTETPFRQTTPAGAPTAAQPALAGSLQPKADCTEVCPSFCAWSPAFRVGPLAQPCGGLGPVVVGCWPRRAHLFQNKLSPETRRLGLEQAMTEITYLSTFWPCR
jgi:hypothetical protein